MEHLRLKELLSYDKTTGVCWDKSCNKWKVSISVNCKRINLGLFDNLERAVCARKSAEREYGHLSD